VFCQKSGAEKEMKSLMSAAYREDYLTHGSSDEEAEWSHGVDNKDQSKDN